MRNAEVAEVLNELADYSDVKGEEWEARAYRRAARNIETLQASIEEVHAEGKLEEIDGVGQAIAEKVADHLETGQMSALETIREEVPVDVPGLLAVQGLGPKGIKKLYEALDVTDLDSLEAAATQGRIAEVKGFGEKTQEKIIDHIGFVREARSRTLLGIAEGTVADLVETLMATGRFDRLEPAGSFRRRLPTVGDVDLLATAQAPVEALETVTDLELVDRVLGQGETKASVVTRDGLQVDVRVVDPSSWGAALQYFTGSKDHNVEVRRRAQARDLKVNEYGVFDDEGSQVAGTTEEEVYGALGMTWVPPELREGLGEVQAAADGDLPDLVTLEDIQGDLQMHTTWSDGAESVEAMARKAAELGYSYILITDHGPSLTVTGPPALEEIPEQGEEIRAADEAVDGVRVLHGIEANITKDGMDVPPEVCEELDLVVASLHDTVTDATDRVLRAFEAYPVDIFAHPTNRLIGQREGNQLDLPAIVEAATEHKIAIEINAQPNRLDLDWLEVHRFRDAARFVISTDAHSPAGMETMHLGVEQARKGWLTRDHVLNAGPLEELLAYVGRA